MENSINWLPLLTTLLGGILAVGGGIVSAILIQSHTSKRENIKIVTQKCEEIFKMILKIDHYTQHRNNSMRENDFDGDPPEEVNLSQYEWKELEMLVSLYLPNSQQMAREYIKARDNHMLKYGYCLLKRSKGEDPINESFLEDLQDIHEKYMEASKILKKDIVDNFPVRLTI